MNRFKCGLSFSLWLGILLSVQTYSQELPNNSVNLKAIVGDRSFYLVLTDSPVALENANGTIYAPLELLAYLAHSDGYSSYEPDGGATILLGDDYIELEGTEPNIIRTRDAYYTLESPIVWREGKLFAPIKPLLEALNISNSWDPILRQLSVYDAPIFYSYEFTYRYRQTFTGFAPTPVGGTSTAAVLLTNVTIRPGSEEYNATSSISFSRWGDYSVHLNLRDGNGSTLASTLHSEQISTCQSEDCNYTLEFLTDRLADSSRSGLANLLLIEFKVEK